MPQVIIRTGFIDPEGREETVTAYLCDVADCPNPAATVMGYVRELAASFAVCDAHTATLQK